MMLNLDRRLFATGLLALAACATGQRSGVVRAGPPLWRIDSGASKVFLFGQIPMPAGIDWLTADIEAAFNQSQEIWFENPEFDPVTTNAAIQKRLAAGGPKLSETIGPQDRQRLRDALSKAGLAPDAFDAQPVWQAYNSLSNIADKTSGMDPASLPERVLKPRAKASGKTIRSEWASMDEIMAFSSEQTLQQHLQLIAKTLDELSGPEELKRRAEAWARGDIGTEAARIDRFGRIYPELSARVNAERNRRWTPRVKEMLSRPGSTFVCVGLGHLVGWDSIQIWLKRSGLKVDRV